MLLNPDTHNYSALDVTLHSHHSLGFDLVVYFGRGDKEIPVLGSFSASVYNHLRFANKFTSITAVRCKAKTKGRAVFIVLRLACTFGTSTSH